MKMTFRIVFWGGLIVFFAVVAVAVFTPVAVWRPTPTDVSHPYTAQEAAGRTLFYSNGCNYCHTQYVRDVDNAMGPVSEAGNYYYDNPMILGSERTGPDLSYVGRKRSMQWEIDHMRWPRQYSPLSIMPDFTFLSTPQATDIAAYLFNLGDRSAAEFMITPPALYASRTLPVIGSVVKTTDPNAPAQGWPTFKAAGLYDGKLIYASHCLTCHGCAGNGLGTYGGTLIVTPANFKVDPFRTMPDDQWFWHVSEGVQGSVMPPWKESLTVQERWDVIRFVQQVYAAPFERDPNEGSPTPAYQKKNPLPITIANIDAGKRIWTRECAVCHGDEGKGQGVYRQGIEPVPPNFDNPANYDPYIDADYFWRVSEGVPWTAMPTWKKVYTAQQRWQLVTYIRTMFTQTDKKPAQLPEAESFAITPTERSMTVPKGTTYEAGRQQFLIQCAHCHGLAGDGKGWDGTYLNPAPANLQKKLASSQPDITEGTTFAKVTNGIDNTAMPIWGEFLNADMRLADVKYLKDSFNIGTGAAGKTSHYGNGAVPLPYVRTDTGIFEAEIATISPDAGKAVYEQYCATCHGETGAGDGAGAKGLPGGAPAPFPGPHLFTNLKPSAPMNLPYIFAVTRSGIPGTMMYGFQPLLTETDIWNVSTYTLQVTGGKFGG